MTDWIKSSGIIKYDPFRHGMKKRTEWWCILEVDREITRYYRWWVKNRYWIDLTQPSWNAHVSIIRGEKPEDRFLELWKKYDGKRVEFEYSPTIKKGTNGTKYNKDEVFWSLDIKCPFLLEIRQEMEKPCHWGLHLTIGKTPVMRPNG